MCGLMGEVEAETALSSTSGTRRGVKAQGSSYPLAGTPKGPYIHMAASHLTPIKRETAI